MAMPGLGARSYSISSHHNTRAASLECLHSCCDAGGCGNSTQEHSAVGKLCQEALAMSSPAGEEVVVLLHKLVLKPALSVYIRATMLFRAAVRDMVR